MYLALLSPLYDRHFFLSLLKHLLICFWLFWVPVAVCGLSLVAVSRRRGVAGVAVFAAGWLLTVVAALLVAHGLFWA